MTPKITAAIACYQAEDTIERAVESALAQDWPEVEVLVVDDASTDDSAALVAARARGEPRLRLIRHRENRGAGAVRQTLLTAASGTYIAFFDDDDVSEPQRLRRQFDALTRYLKRSGVSEAVCYASGSRVYPNGYVLDLPAIGSRPEVPAGEAVADYLLFNRRHDALFYGSGTPTCALLAAVKTLVAVGGFDPGQRRVEDADLAVRLARRGAHFVGCPEKLFRQYATQASDKSPEKNFKAELRLIDKNRDYLEKRRRYGYARRWTHLRYHHFRGSRFQMGLDLCGLAFTHPVTAARHLLRSAGQRWRHERRIAARGSETPATTSETRSVIFVVTEDWYFWSHRRPMAKAVQAMGYRVIVATRVSSYRTLIAEAGFEPVHIPFNRASLNPLTELHTIWSLFALFRRVRPQAVFAVALKPIVDAGTAALLAGRLPIVNVFAGMGSVLGGREGNPGIRFIVQSAIRMVVALSRAHTVVQNHDDRSHVVSLGYASESSVTVIPGSGVDLEAFKLQAEPDGPVTALMVGRLIADKGVRELVEAAQRLSRESIDLRIWIAGQPDPANPRGISEETLQAWAHAGPVRFLGHRDDIANLWSHAHIAVLPSYREGLPMSLLEAAACGRPVVTTDVVGCRDLVPDGRTGILVPPFDPDALAQALATLANDPSKRRAMGQAARLLVETRFSSQHVVQATQRVMTEAFIRRLG